MISQALQTAIDSAETALAAAQQAQQTEASGKDALQAATEQDAANVAALEKAKHNLDVARQAVIETATTEFTLPAPQPDGDQAAS